MIEACTRGQRQYSTVGWLAAGRLGLARRAADPALQDQLCKAARSPRGLHKRLFARLDTVLGKASRDVGVAVAGMGAAQLAIGGVERRALACSQAGGARKL